MLSEILKYTKKRKLILLGEIHGTKEIPELIIKLFSRYARYNDFDVCMEIPKSNQKFIDNFLTVGDESILKRMPFFRYVNLSDGRNSLEYFNLIKKISALNLKFKRKIHIFCVDIDEFNTADPQNERELKLAENISKHFNNKTTFAILGNIHASKNIYAVGGKEIITTGYHLNKLFKNNVASINIMPMSGTFYNLGLKRINKKSNLPKVTRKKESKGYDLDYSIQKVSPCSFTAFH